MKEFHGYVISENGEISSENKKFTYRETKSSLMVYLFVGGKSSPFSIRSIVRSLYGKDKKYHNSKEIRNIDGDIFNNSVENLELIEKIKKDMVQTKEGEIWKSYENIEISNFGRVKNSKGILLKPIIQKKRILIKGKGNKKLKVNSHSYYYIEVKDLFSGVRRRISLPLIVMSLFKKDNTFISIYGEITHKDGNRANNHIDNLEYKSIL